MESLVEMIVVALVGVSLLSCVITLVMHFAAWKKSIASKRSAHGNSPISILRPLKGVVEGLEENLESLCLQHHTRYEILVSAADASDPALQIARRVRERHPRVAFRILHGEWPTGQNPKVRLLRAMASRAQYPNLLISDDNVRVRADYLAVLAGALECRSVGLVSNLVVGIGARTLGAICENLYLNTFVLSGVAASALFGRPVVVGKSMLMRRDALAKAGGFAAVADVLAEDHLLGRAIAKAGYRVVTLGHPVYTINVRWSIRGMLDRHVRWCKIRGAIAPCAFVFELLAHPLLWLSGTLVALMQSQMPSGPTVVGAMVVASCAAVMTLAEAFLLRHVTGAEFRLAHLLALPLRTVLAVTAYAGSFFVPVVRWRNEQYRIGKNSRLLPVKRPIDAPFGRSAVSRAA
ncbi:MAG: glycosyltransferase [Polyangiaceae bacterium]